jgi:hypothetical protein
VRQGNWIVLHYLYFYSMNNWRSGFFGVNDHEADWEQVFVYLYEAAEGQYVPHWVAFASHDFAGDDLRRRWDDPHLVKEGEHPVVFVGAGSHASYFERGEYVMGIEPKWLTPVKNAFNGLRRFWVETLGQGESEQFVESVGALLSVPFVDYARGDGVIIGAHKSKSWVPMLISDNDGWVDRYRGLWGLDTRDRLGGERAPAGPKYDRSGAIRLSWYDPLGWAGLDKVFPPSLLLGEIDERLAAIETELATVGSDLEREREALRVLALDVESLRAAEHFSGVYEVRFEELQARQTAFQAQVQRRVEMSETRTALVDYRRRVEQGDLGSPTAHIRHAHRPAPEVKQRRVLELWAAMSGALALMAFGYLIIYRPNQWILLALIVAVSFGVIDALARGKIDRYLTNLTVALAVVNAIILFIVFWQIALIIPLILLVVFMLRDNLRELR